MTDVISQTTFYKIVSFTLAREGGFSNRPQDKGGPTKYGITQATLSEFRGRAALEQDIENLSEEEALKVYADRFWNLGNFARISSQRTALIVFDFGVMAGPRTALMALQRVLNKFLGPGLALKVDGFLGDKTCAALKVVPERDLNRALIQAVQEHLVKASDGPDSIFLSGWIKRTHLVWDKVEEWYLPV